MGSNCTQWDKLTEAKQNQGKKIEVYHQFFLESCPESEADEPRSSRSRLAHLVLESSAKSGTSWPRVDPKVTNRQRKWSFYGACFVYIARSSRNTIVKWSARIALPSWLVTMERSAQNFQAGAGKNFVRTGPKLRRGNSQTNSSNF